jgi:hypothetical protein
MVVSPRGVWVTRDLKPLRRRGADPPAGPGRRWFGKRILVETTSTAQKKDGHVSLGRDQLQTAGCHHGDFARLRDDCRWCAVTYRILDHRQEGRVISGLGMDHGCGR